MAWTLPLLPPWECGGLLVHYDMLQNGYEVSFESLCVLQSAELLVALHELPIFSDPKGQDKGEVHSRTGHEGPEGE
jgi:hypothetical protein